jgi:plasmid stabilization system protein ParE
MNIRILSSAYNDLVAGKKFYERQSEGLGEYFLNTLFSDIDSLLLHGGIHRKVYGYHRLLSKRFPYAIYYKMDKIRDILVWRVLDCRQDPKNIKKALNYQTILKDKKCQY